MATVPAAALPMPGFARTLVPPPKLRINLLGGFRVKRADGWLPDYEWRQRRSARQLVKVLATCPEHALHRDQVLDLLWREADPTSALNSLAKALHAARFAVEPGRLPRQGSAYLLLRDELLALDAEFVIVDADHFQQLARTALSSRSVSALESALAAYRGELLPEDRYEDWATERRSALAALHGQLVLRLAEVHLTRNDVSRALEGFETALNQDPTNEDLHRSLIRLHAEMGHRAKAIQQFQVCRETLAEELGVAPSRETEDVYQEVLQDKIRRRPVQLTLRLDSATHSSPMDSDYVDPGLVGRDRELRTLREELVRAERGTGGLVILSGCSGVGKSHLVRSFIDETRRRGITCLHTADHFLSQPSSHAGPLAEIMDQIQGANPRDRPWVEVVGRSLVAPQLAAFTGEADREAASQSARAYESSLGAVAEPPSQLTTDGPIIAELGDLNELQPEVLKLVVSLAHLAPTHPWLLLATLEEEWVAPDSELMKVVDGLIRRDLCHHVELEPLSVEANRALTASLLPEGAVDELIFEHVVNMSLGYPLFAEGVVRAMKDRGEITMVDGQWRPNSMTGRTPPVVRSLVRTHMEHLDETTRLILSVVSTDPAGLNLSLILSAAAVVSPALAGAVVLTAIDRVVQARILDRRDGLFAFHHPLMGQAWMHEMSTLVRTQILGALSQLRNTPSVFRLDTEGASDPAT